MNEFVKRTLSGAAFVGCIVGSILWHPIAFSVLLLLIIILAINEFHILMHSNPTSRFGSIIAGILLWLGTQWALVIPEDVLSHQSWGLYAIIGAAYMLVIVFMLMEALWQPSDNPISNWGNIFISQSMIGVPLCTLGALMYLDKWLLLALFVLIWTNDTGAYCVGSLSAKWMKGGNHKMSPNISPKKSWEGLFGGVAFTIGAAYILNHFGWFESIAGVHHNEAIIVGFALLTCAFATFGDLMESKFKRTIGVKDSGRFLPGHGGVLDRFDSVLLASPLLMLYSYICYMLLSLF